MFLEYCAECKMHANSTYVSIVLHLHAYDVNICCTHLFYMCVLELLYIHALYDLVSHVQFFLHAGHICNYLVTALCAE